MKLFPAVKYFQVWFGVSLGHHLGLHKLPGHGVEKLEMCPRHILFHICQRKFVGKQSVETTNQWVEELEHKIIYPNSSNVQQS